MCANICLAVVCELSAYANLRNQNLILVTYLYLQHLTWCNLAVRYILCQ